MQITPQQVEALLYEEEGPALDFKRGQYPFENASKAEKSELLKDILAFANAFRRSDAFILIGVEEAKGGRSKVIGVTSQLDDAKLQQFVNSKTQRPLTFSYHPLQHDGLPIAVIHIPVQRRPIHTKSDFGKVKKDNVYLRRGSSTDIASPDELAQMGADQAVAQAAEPTLELELFDRESGQALGNVITLPAKVLEIPEETDIPDYTESAHFLSAPLGVNRNYYRKLAKFTRVINFFRPVSFALRNTSGVSAHDVRLIFKVSDPENMYAFSEESDIPEPPKCRETPFDYHMPPLLEPDVTVSRTGATWRVECSFGKIQPRATAKVTSDLFAGASGSGTLSVEGLVFADNLSQPRPVHFDLHFEVEIRSVSLEEIEEMERARFFSTPEGKALFDEMREQKGDE